MVNGYSLVRGIAMVNTVDSLGNIINTTPLTNSGSLVNHSGLLNSSTITLNSNANTLVILGDGDIAILSGDSAGDVTIRSVNVITGNTVGTHLIVPGTFLSNNFNVTYGLGHLTILPDTAEFSIAANSLTQTYDGTPKSVVVTVLPDSVAYTVTYNAGPILAARLAELMREARVPNGLEDVGYDERNVAALVEGTLPQARLLGNAPVTIGAVELERLFRASMRCW